MWIALEQKSQCEVEVRQTDRHGAITARDNYKLTRNIPNPDKPEPKFCHFASKIIDKWPKVCGRGMQKGGVKKDTQGRRGGQYFFEASIDMDGRLAEDIVKDSGGGI